VTTGKPGREYVKFTGERTPVTSRHPGKLQLAYWSGVGRHVSAVIPASKGIQMLNPIESSGGFGKSFPQSNDPVVLPLTDDENSTAGNGLWRSTVLTPGEA
jgi:hypothetical protein